MGTRETTRAVGRLLSEQLITIFNIEHAAMSKINGFDSFEQLYMDQFYKIDIKFYFDSEKLNQVTKAIKTQVVIVFVISTIQ